MISVIRKVDLDDCRALSQVHLLMLQNRALRCQILSSTVMTVRFTAENSCLCMTVMLCNWISNTEVLTAFLLAYRIATLTKMRVSFLQQKMKQ